MAEFRNLDICLDAVTINQMQQVAGYMRFHDALGYLSSWNMTYGYVRITGGIYSGNPELIATYKDEANGPVRYQIGAVWHDDHFGFHS
jgi:hypothetical protein